MSKSVHFFLIFQAFKDAARSLCSSMVKDVLSDFSHTKRGRNRALDDIGLLSCVFVCVCVRVCVGVCVCVCVV